MWKSLISQSRESIASLWHNFYFHWQIKDKTGYILFGIFLFIALAVPTLTYQLVKYKNIQRNIKCLALNIFHEARSESEAGQRAVASVTLNRVASKRYPNNICDVVYEKNWDRIRKRYVGQFSWTEFDKPPKLTSAAWLRAWKIAERAYRSNNINRLNGAIFYHTKYIKPSWARKKKPIAKIGSHIFYK